MANKDYFYITTPIYYVNAQPHIGHTYTTLLCDSVARYYRQKGDEVFFLTGTDEHGDKIARAAQKAGLSPFDFASQNAQAFKSTWEKLHISFNDFIRTTESRHKKVVQKVLQKIYEKKEIYLSEYEGKYCFGCERYLTEKELTAEGKCPDHQVEPTLLKEKNYFFKLQKYLPQVKEILEKNPHMIYPKGYLKETLKAIEELMKLNEDLSISRPKERLTWGIELPFDPNFVTYVWFDALLNYVSATEYPDGEKYHKFWPKATHVIAKDILKPHAIYWPAMLLAAEIPLFQRLMVHGYWLGMGDLKMSKSLGNVQEPLSLAEKISEDGLRYFLLREMHFGQDARFSEEELLLRLNQDLANNLGNLIQRVLSMLKKYAQEFSQEKHALEEPLNEALSEMAKTYHEALANFQFHEAIEALLKVSQFLNQQIEVFRPWDLAKKKDPTLKALLTTLAKGIVVLLCYLKPIMPHKSEIFLSLLIKEVKNSFPLKLDEIILKPSPPESWPIFFQKIE